MARWHFSALKEDPKSAMHRLSAAHPFRRQRWDTCAQPLQAMRLGLAPAIRAAATLATMSLKSTPSPNEHRRGHALRTRGRGSAVVQRLSTGHASSFRVSNARDIDRTWGWALPRKKHGYSPLDGLGVRRCSNVRGARSQLPPFQTAKHTSSGASEAVRSPSSVAMHLLLLLP